MALLAWLGLDSSIKKIYTYEMHQYSQSSCDDVQSIIHLLSYLHELVCANVLSEGHPYIPGLSPQLGLSMRDATVHEDTARTLLAQVPLLPSFASSVASKGFTTQKEKLGAHGLSQLVLHMTAGTTEVLHRHDLHNQTRPARKVLRALALARLRIILLPREARLLPALVDGADEILTQAAVEILGLGLIWTRLCGDILFVMLALNRRLCANLACST